MITFRQVDKSFLPIYDKVTQNVEINSELRVRPVDGGLGGLVFEEVPVSPHIKDLAEHDRVMEFEKQFDISTWKFFLALDGEIPVGAATLAGKTPGLYMAGGREDVCVLWDIRVADKYKHQGIGQKLFDLCKTTGKKDGYNQMVIECQNNNIPAIHFYRKQGAVLGKVDRYAYYTEPECRDEVQLVWHLDL